MHIIIFALLADWSWSQGLSMPLAIGFTRNELAQRCGLLSRSNDIWSRIWASMSEILGKGLEFRIQCCPPLGACHTVK